MDEECIKPEQCGCVVNSTYIPVGFNVTSEDCSEECSCQETRGNITCKPKRCHQHATCSFQNDQRNCYCNEGLMGDGINDCVDVSTNLDFPMLWICDKSISGGVLKHALCMLFIDSTSLHFDEISFHRIRVCITVGFNRSLA